METAQQRDKGRKLRERNDGEQTSKEEKGGAKQGRKETESRIETA